MRVGGGRTGPGIALLALSALALGWNPLVRRDGGPLRWPTDSPVSWNPDGGGLGLLSNAEANQMVAEAFAAWEAVPTARIAFAQGPQIVDATGTPVDVTPANYAEVMQLDNGQNPIIYDNDQQIWELLGVSTSVLGFAGVLRNEGASVVKGYAVLQGDWIDGVEIRYPNCGGSRCDPELPMVDQFLNIVVHEAGHFVGLGHSSVNHEVDGIGACPAPGIDKLETMSPLAHYAMKTLHHDDAVGLSVLYPTAAFEADLARMSGRVVDRDGATPFDGANVILRPDTADCDLLYDRAQATQTGVNPLEDGGAGTFRFSGLDPAAGYTLFLTDIADGGGYPIGGTSPPPLGGPAEYYNGPSEAHFDPPDDPAQVTAVTTGAAGAEPGGVELRINNPGGPGAVEGVGPEALRVAKLGGGGLLLSWGPACNATLVPDQDFAVYRGSLASLAGIQDHQPLACGTGGATSLAVDDGGGDAYFLVAPLLAGREGDLGRGTGARPRTPLVTCGEVQPDACP